MKKIISISLTVVAILLMSAMSGQAGRYYRGGGHGWGPGWGPAIGLGLGLGLWELSNPYYGYPYYPYYYQAPIVQQPSTEIYVQPEQQQPVEPSYWYYCQNPQGYYPYVKKCPNGWMKVVPSPPPADEEE